MTTDPFRVRAGNAWGQVRGTVTSDTDSASCSSKSHESSPSGSPHRGSRRNMKTSHSLEELDEDEVLQAASPTIGTASSRGRRRYDGDDISDLSGIIGVSNTYCYFLVSYKLF